MRNVSRPSHPRAPWHALRPVAALCAIAALLPACGGSDGDDAPTTATLSGVVADGPLQGAIVCYDLDDSGTCDAGEPGATTDADGQYQFTVDLAVSGRHAVLADVPASAIDKDTGAAVGVAFQLKAPASGSRSDHAVFVSPLTTVVADTAAANGSTVAEAVASVQAQLGLAVSPMTDFTAAGADVAVGQAARALGQVMISTARMASAAGVAAGPAAQLVRETGVSQLAEVAAALAAAPAEASQAERSAAAVAAVNQALNLSAATAAALAGQLAAPAGPTESAGAFISVRRFAYTDANHYSYQLFTGDSSQVDGNGRYTAHEARRNVANGVDLPFSRNQMYWSGSEWQVCDNGWQVVTGIKPETATTPQLATYCGGSQTSTRTRTVDIAGKTLREVITTMRASPLRDSVGSTTDANGLPVNWGPDPALLPADAVFPAGALMSSRSQLADIGNTDRIELTVKPNVRWPDGVYRQATTLEHYSGMPGDLGAGLITVGAGNTAFVDDEALAEQADATLDKVKRWRIGLDVAGLKARFYRCDLRIADQASINCLPQGDATLAIATQGGIRLLRVASGYPAALKQMNFRQRFWAEHAGTVFRGTTDLQRTRYDQRLNATAWTSLQTALGIAAHTNPAAPPAAKGPFEVLRSFSFSNAGNYSWRVYSGDDSVADGNGIAVANEQRKTVAGGLEQPHPSTRSLWTGTEWYDCPATGATITYQVAAPFVSTYCKAYVDERVLPKPLLLSLGGRLMSDVVNEIRAYGSLDNGTSVSTWGPQPAAHPVLAGTRFPDGATMEYRGQKRTAADWTINTAASAQVRVPPAANTPVPFNAWPFAATLEDVVARHPGNLVGSTLNGSTALFVASYTETPSDPAFTNRVEIRVAFDANGNKVRFTRNNISASTGFTTNYSTLLDTTYSIDAVGGVRLLKFAAQPAGFESRFDHAVLYAERQGAVWYAYKAPTPAVNWSIRLNGTAKAALFGALGIQ